MAEPAPLVAPARVNPYSVIDITPFQEDQLPPSDLSAEEEAVGLQVPSGYSVPVPCGYAVPCSLPLLQPAYCSPAVIRRESVEEEGTAPVLAQQGPRLGCF